MFELVFFEQLKPYLLSHCSTGFPQKPQGSPSLFKCGFWLAQVPANLPSFLAHILIAIPATPKAKNSSVIRNSFISFNFLQIYKNHLYLLHFIWFS